MWIRNQFGNLINLDNTVAIAADGAWVVAHVTTAGTPQEIDNQWTICKMDSHEKALEVVDAISRGLQAVDWDEV